MRLPSTRTGEQFCDFLVGVSGRSLSYLLHQMEKPNKSYKFQKNLTSDLYLIESIRYTKTIDPTNYQLIGEMTLKFRIISERVIDGPSKTPALFIAASLKRLIIPLSVRNCFFKSVLRIVE